MSGINTQYTALDQVRFRAKTFFHKTNFTRKENGFEVGERLTVAQEVRVRFQEKDFFINFFSKKKIVFKREKRSTLAQEVRVTFPEKTFFLKMYFTVQKIFEIFLLRQSLQKINRKVFLVSEIRICVEGLPRKNFCVVAVARIKNNFK